MKKWTTALLSVILAMGITACGSEDKDNADSEPASPQPAEQQTPETPKENTETETETEAEAPAEGALPSVDELIQKGVEASQGLKSFSMESAIQQSIVVGAGDQQQEQNVNMEMTADVVVEPVEMYQEMKIEMPGEGTQEVNQYITQNGIYSQVDGQWFQLPEEMVQSVMAGVEQTAQAPEQQMEQLKSITEDTKVSEDGDNYILTADVSGENVKKLAETYMNQTGTVDEQTAAIMEQMNIKSMKIVYGVNKETYLPTVTDVNMVMDMEEEGQSITISMVVTGMISKHNEIEKIEVPQEALDSASSPSNVE